jgi:hypothetical protein
MMHTPLTIASILFLGLSIVAVWLPNRRAWLALYGCSIICALASGWIQPIAILSLCTFALVVWLSAWNLQGGKAYAVNTLVVFATIVAAAHIAPGFMSFNVLEDTQLSDRTAWSALRFSADKPSIGLFLLVSRREFLCRSFSELGCALATSAWVITAGCAAIYFFSLQIGFIELDVTFSWVIGIWFVRNLIFTVVAEEALFRGFIQPKIESHLSTRNRSIIAVLLTAILFGSVHLYGGWQYGLIATIAGVLYGYAFMKTGRLEMAMVAHVALNLGHILFFSYP